MSTLEECDLCHDLFGLMDITFTGRQFLCAACYNEKEIE